MIVNLWLIHDPKWGPERLFVQSTPPTELQRGEQTRVFQVNVAVPEPVPVDDCLFLTAKTPSEAKAVALDAIRHLLFKS